LASSMAPHRPVHSGPGTTKCHTNGGLRSWLTTRKGLIAELPLFGTPWRLRSALPPEAKSTLVATKRLTSRPFGGWRNGANACLSKHAASSIAAACLVPYLRSRLARSLELCVPRLATRILTPPAHSGFYPSASRAFIASREYLLRSTGRDAFTLLLYKVSNTHRLVRGHVASPAFWSTGL
jgi:hypothetical protein